jgi:hypothetical protein
LLRIALATCLALWGMWHRHNKNIFRAPDNESDEDRKLRENDLKVRRTWIEDQYFEAPLIDLDLLCDGLFLQPTALEYGWIHFMMLTTLIPTVIHFMVAGAAAMLVIPNLLRHFIRAQWDRRGESPYPRVLVRIRGSGARLVCPGPVALGAVCVSQRAWRNNWRRAIELGARTCGVGRSLCG